MTKTSADLISNVRRRAQLSQDSGQAISDADILAFASDELQNVIAPKIYATRGWHYATLKQYALSAKRYYRIPSRAAGGTIVSVEIVNSTPPNRLVNYVHPLQTNQTQSQGASESYCLYNNNIMLSAGCPSSGYMIVRFLIAPSAITGNAFISAGYVGSDTLQGSVVGDGPSFWIPQSFGNVDLYSGTSPYEIIVTDVTADYNDASSIVFESNIFTDQPTLDSVSTIEGLTITDLRSMASAGGITVSDTGKCYSPQLYDEHHDLLAQRTAMRCMEAIGHTEDLKNMSQKLADLESAFLKSISPRERGDMKVILAEDFYYDRRF